MGSPWAHEAPPQLTDLKPRSVVAAARAKENHAVLRGETGGWLAAGPGSGAGEGGFALEQERCGSRRESTGGHGKASLASACGRAVDLASITGAAEASLGMTQSTVEESI